MIFFNPALQTRIGPVTAHLAWRAEALAALSSVSTLTITRNGSPVRVYSAAAWIEVAGAATVGGIMSGPLSNCTLSTAAVDWSDGAIYVATWVLGTYQISGSIGVGGAVDFTVSGNLAAGQAGLGIVVGCVVRDSPVFAGAPSPAPGPGPAPGPAPAPSPVPTGEVFTSQFPTTVRLSLAPGAPAGTANDFVSFGMPVSRIHNLTNLSQVRVQIGGNEVPCNVRGGLKWWDHPGQPWRSVIVQINADMTGGDVIATVDLAGRTVASDLAARPYANCTFNTTYVDDVARPLRCPKVLPLHDPAYIGKSGFSAPFEGPTSGDTYELFLTELRTRSRNAGGPLWTNNFPGYSSVIPSGGHEGWLYDRSSALFMQSLGTSVIFDRKEFLFHAAISKYHYWLRVVQTGAFKGEYLFDSASTTGDYDYKYWTLQSAKVVQMLLGDDTQIDQSVAEAKIDRILFRGTSFYAVNLVNPLQTEAALWTERQQAAYVNNLLQLYELYGIRKAELVDIINKLRTIQTVPFAWETANGWAKSGMLEHSWKAHEGFGGPYFGVTAAPVSVGQTSVTLKPAVTGQPPIVTIADLMKLRPGVCVGRSIALFKISGMPVNNGNGTVTVACEPAVGAVSADQAVFNTQGSNSLWPAEPEVSNFALDRASSPWMMALLAEPFWALIHYLPSADSMRATCSQFLSDLANGIDLYAYDSTWNGSTYVRRTVDPNYNYPNFLKPGNARSGYAASQHWSGEMHGAVSSEFLYADVHAPEICNMMSYGAWLSTGPTKTRYLARMSATMEYWQDLFVARLYDTGSVRSVAWKDRALPFRVKQWVENQ